MIIKVYKISFVIIVVYGLREVAEGGEKGEFYDCIQEIGSKIRSEQDLIIIHLNGGVKNKINDKRAGQYGESPQKGKGELHSTFVQ